MILWAGCGAVAGALGWAPFFWLARPIESQLEWLRSNPAVLTICERWLFTTLSALLYGLLFAVVAVPVGALYARARPGRGRPVKGAIRGAAAGLIAGVSGGLFSSASFIPLRVSLIPLMHTGVPLLLIAVIGSALAGALGGAITGSMLAVGVGENHHARSR
jgi:hypothetical protein